MKSLQEVRSENFKRKSGCGLKSTFLSYLLSYCLITINISYIPPRTHNLIMVLAIKYTDTLKNESEDLDADLPLEVLDTPDIIISETFQ